MIIVEGPDGAGKSTLVRQLAQELSLPVLPRACTSEGGPVENLAKWVEDDIRTWPKTGIIDRYPLFSEPIYGNVIRGHLAEHFDNRLWFETTFNYIKHFGVVVIFALPPMHVVREAITQQGQMYGVVDHIDQIYRYYSFIATLDQSILVWDYTADTFSRFVGEVVANMDHRGTLQGGKK